MCAVPGVEAALAAAVAAGAGVPMLALQGSVADGGGTVPPRKPSLVAARAAGAAPGGVSMLAVHRRLSPVAEARGAVMDGVSAAVGIRSGCLLAC